MGGVMSGLGWASLGCCSIVFRDVSVTNQEDSFNLLSVDVVGQETCRIPDWARAQLWTGHTARTEGTMDTGVAEGDRQTSN